MANYACANGHTWQGRSSLSRRFSPAELHCPEPDCGLRAEPKLKQGSGFKADRESSARRDAREHFNRSVLNRRGCFYSAYSSPMGKPRRKGHVCVYPMDAHHLCEKSWIEENFADLPEEERLKILFDPRIGAPLCRGGHENVASLRIFWDEVSEECKEACQEVDRRWLEVPTLAGTRRQSMLGRLEIECPKREAVTAASERSSA